jgi:hypothetical protein
MNTIIPPGTYLGTAAAANWIQVRGSALFTRYCIEKSELPIGEDGEGFLLFDEVPWSLSGFSFYAPYNKDGFRLEIGPPTLWRNPAFFVSEYSLLGNGIDRIVMTSRDPQFVEIHEIDTESFFDRQVSVKRNRPRRYRTFRFAKSYRKPVVLRRFLGDYRFDPTQRDGSIDWLLRNNLVEMSLAHMRSRSRK